MCCTLSLTTWEEEKKRARIWLRRESRRIEWDRSGTVVQCLDSNYIRLNHILYTCLPLPLLCSHFNSSDERVFVSQQHQHNINKLNGSNWRAVVAGWKEKTLYKLKLIVRVQYEKIHSSRTQTVHLLSLSITTAHYYCHCCAMVWVTVLPLLNLFVRPFLRLVCLFFCLLPTMMGHSARLVAYNVCQHSVVWYMCVTVTSSRFACMLEFKLWMA